MLKEIVLIWTQGKDMGGVWGLDSKLLSGGG
jgi:hypothetical protein